VARRLVRNRILTAARRYTSRVVGARAIWAFIKLGRPKFLAGGFLFYGIGAALAVAAGAPFDASLFVWGQAIVTAAQLMTHYSNDFFDLEADRANRTPTRWSGGSRILPDGILPPGVALGAALALCLVALGAALALALRTDERPLLLPIAVIITTLAWSYSAPPARLAARGLGELTTAVVVTLCVPLLGYYLQAGEIHPRVFAACLLPCLLQFAMLLAIELPDAAGDAVTGKRTLVVRMGAAAGARLYAVLTIAGFGALPLLARDVLPWRVAIAPLALAPLAIWQAARVVRGDYADPARWESVAFWSVALVSWSGAAVLVATMTLAWARGG
jgi:1,4-dihydroxy-2-naphthoate octaprenyltransferase